MPLLHIDVIRGHDEDRLTATLDAIHDAVVEAFHVPTTDRYQVLTQHEPYEMRALDTGLGYTRSHDLTIIRVISKPRPQQAKQKLYRLIATNLHHRVGIDPQDVIVSLVENSDADWSFGMGQAQFLTRELSTDEPNSTATPTE